MLVAMLGHSVSATEPHLAGPRNSLRTIVKEVAAPQDQEESIFHKPICAVGTQIATSDTDAVRKLKIPAQKLQRVNINDTQSNLAREANWEAPATCHYPLYFEEVNLERYGYSHFGCLQPVASAAHFFGTVPLLPYKMTLHPSRECLYTLGHYRPGSCVPYRINQLPLRLSAAAVEGLVVTSAVFLIP